MDATINPDFSQIEADTAQISVNERFALFYPEKRPFFLEHVDLLQTPIQAVYTRTITQPLWGARITGKTGGTNFTALVASDEGGGTVIIPGPVFSETAPQDYESTVAIARVRQDLGDSFAGVLATGRVIEGGGYNAVVGGDFHWQAGEDDVVNGQYLYSFSQNPDRPDLYPGWLGQKQSGFGWDDGVDPLDRRPGSGTSDYEDFAPGFLADDGFVPQVGYREGSAGLGYRFFPTGFFSRLRPLAGANYSDRPRRRPDLAALLSGDLVPGAVEPVAARSTTTSKPSGSRARRSNSTASSWSLQASPSRFVPRITFAGNYGEQPDVSNVRVGNGGTLSMTTTIRPTAHLALDLIGETAVDRRDRRRARGPPLHRDRRPRQGDLRLQLPDVLPGDRPVHRDDARSPPLDVSRPGEGVGVLRVGPVRLQAQLADRARMSATATTAPSSRAAGPISSPRTGSSSSKSRTRSRSDRAAVAPRRPWRGHPEAEALRDPELVGVAGILAALRMTATAGTKSAGAGFLCWQNDEYALRSRRWAGSCGRGCRPRGSDGSGEAAAGRGREAAHADSGDGDDRARPAATTPPTWKEVDRLVSEQKFEEASRAIDALLQSAKARKDSAEWTKALIRSVQVRTGLHGYETAVRFLKDEPWPPDLLSRAALELFYAQSLVNYARMYSWEVSQRERVESKGTVDLKAWTREQIYDEAVRAYVALWKEREALGRENVKALAEFMEPNDYPPGIRPTLRDAVAYFFADLLADSSGWSPAQSNAVYALDLAGLLRADAKSTAAIRLDDPAVHPVERFVAVLADLEGWHAGRGEREAAFEARLERLRRLQRCLYRGRGSGRDRERSRGAPAEDGGSALVRDGPGAARRAPRIR